MRSSPAPEKRPFTWSESLALPIVVSVMEAQPIALLLLLGAGALSGTAALSPLSAGDLTLLALGLLWWGNAVEWWRRGHAGKRAISVAQVAGWLLALSLVAVARFTRQPGLAPGVVDLALVTWFWQRGLRRAQTRLEYEDLQASFKAGIAIVVAVLLIVALNRDLAPLADQMTLSVPIFFLAGLLAVSLARLGAIRDARQRLDGPQADPTRIWLVALSALCLGVLALALSIESLVSLATLQHGLGALAPVWGVLGAAVTWVVYAIAFALTPLVDLAIWIINGLLALFGHVSGNGASRPAIAPPSLPPSPAQQPPAGHGNPGQGSGFPPLLIDLARWALVLALGWALVASITRGLRRWLAFGAGVGVEETRESLDARALRRRRQRVAPQQAQAAREVERLDPTSARARYRELLQAAVEAGADLGRRQGETPTEYEDRLIALLEIRASDEGGFAGVDSHTRAALGEVTAAYQAERYGGLAPSRELSGRLRDLISHLRDRLFGQAPAPARARRRRA